MLSDTEIFALYESKRLTFLDSEEGQGIDAGGPLTMRAARRHALLAVAAAVRAAEVEPLRDVEHMQRAVTEWADSIFRAESQQPLVKAAHLMEEAEEVFSAIRDGAPTGDVTNELCDVLAAVLVIAKGIDAPLVQLFWAKLAWLKAQEWERVDGDEVYYRRVGSNGNQGVPPRQTRADIRSEVEPLREAYRTYKQAPSGPAKSDALAVLVRRLDAALAPAPTATGGE